MKLKRSERLIDMTQRLLDNPHTLISLTSFTDLYQSAKSSISEDIAIIKRTFEIQGIGIVNTLPGAAGGVIFTPKIKKEQALEAAQKICDQMNDSTRLLPGGYIYLSDLLGKPDVLHHLGKMIASAYEDQKVNVIMTVATKGVPIAQTVANYLNVPFVIVRRDSKITEGATVSINYVSGSSSRVEKMELSKRTLPSGSNVLIVDDFLKAGGTINGMRSLIKEFDSHAVGAVVFCESGVSGHQLQDYSSIIRITEINTENQHIKAELGNFFDTHTFLEETH